MRDLRTLFEYQKFKPNDRLQVKIDAITEKYMSNGIELDDDELDVAAAGEAHQSEPPVEEKKDADKG